METSGLSTPIYAYIQMASVLVVHPIDPRKWQRVFQNRFGSWVHPGRLGIANSGAFLGEVLTNDWSKKVNSSRRCLPAALAKHCHHPLTKQPQLNPRLTSKISMFCSLLQRSAFSASEAFSSALQGYAHRNQLFARSLHFKGFQTRFLRSCPWHSRGFLTSFDGGASENTPSMNALVVWNYFGFDLAQIFERITFDPLRVFSPHKIYQSSTYFCTHYFACVPKKWYMMFTPH